MDFIRIPHTTDPYADFQNDSRTPFLAGLATVEAGNRYAENFTLEPKETYQLLTIRNPLAGNAAEQSFALVSGNDPLPDLPSDYTILRVPLRRMLALETVPLGYLDALHSLDALAGVGSVPYITNPTIREALKQETLQAVPSGPGLDAEAILLLQPDLLLTSASNDPASNLPEALLRAGPAILATTGYLEPHPLGRAEWLRVFAALLGKSVEADRIFNAVADRYEELAASTKWLTDRRTVFCQAPFAGVWHLPGGKSHTAQLIADAGGGTSGPTTPGKPVFLSTSNAYFFARPKPTSGCSPESIAPSKPCSQPIHASGASGQCKQNKSTIIHEKPIRRAATRSTKKPSSGPTYS